jgi:hypothetical protein
VIVAPFADGGEKDTVAAPLLNARLVPTSTAVGLATCEGAAAEAVIELLVALTGELVPLALLAVIVKVYEVPGIRSTTVKGEVEPLAVNPPDVDATW